MGIREKANEAIESALWVVNWVSSALASDSDVEAQVDDPAGNENANGDAAEVWSIAGVQSRPKDGNASNGYAKALRVQLGDTVLIIGTHDPRHVEPCEAGELLLHALGKDGASRALIRLKPDGTVEVEGEAIKLGQGATMFAAIADYVDARLSTIKTAYNGHKHTETGGTTNVPDTLIGALDSVAASKVKVE